MGLLEVVVLNVVGFFGGVVLGFVGGFFSIVVYVGVFILDCCAVVGVCVCVSERGVWLMIWVLFLAVWATRGLQESCNAKVVYFDSNHRAQTAKALQCARSGVSTKSRKSAKPHFLQKSSKSAVLRIFWRSFWNWRKPHFFVHFNVFAV